MKNPSLILGKVQTRFGLSLMELMVVILIIGILTVISAGAVVKWLQWQKDTDNPKSAAGIIYGNIKEAIDRIRTDITQRAKQEFTQLSATQRAAFGLLGDNLSSQNNKSTNFMALDGNDPNSRALTVFTNWKIYRYFPNKFQNITQLPMSFACDSYGSPENPSLKTIVESNSQPPAKIGYNSMANLTLLSVQDKLQFLPVENSIYKKIAAAYTPIPNILNPDDETLRIIASSLLLISLTTHPKGMKQEELAGAIATYSQSNPPIQYISTPNGEPIFHLLHYVDYNEYQSDRNYRPGALRVDAGFLRK